MNKTIEYELIILGTTIFIPVSKKIINIILPQSYIKDFIIISMSQYTNWNIFLIFINLINNNSYLKIFITINSTTIFIIYHIFYITNRQLIKKIPNIPSFCNQIHIDIASFFVHVLPFIMYNFYYTNYKLNHNIGYHVVLYNMVWCFQCFLSFNPHTVYFNINDENVYLLWCFTMLTHISVGYLLNYLTYHDTVHPYLFDLL